MASKNLFQVSEIKLLYKNKIKAKDRPQITSSMSAYDIFRAQWSEQIEAIEEFNILVLNRANRVIGIANISKGGVAGTVVDAKVIFSIAVKALACSIILAHNHPSGNLKPSQADIQITKKLKKAGELLDITVLDHLIIAGHSYYSFADDGML